MIPMRGARRDYQLAGLFDDLEDQSSSRSLGEIFFDEFWCRYPRKIGKGAASKAYAKALKKARHDDIMFALSQQLPIMEAKDKQYIPHASTWLNQERWLDEPEEPNSMGGPRLSRPDTTISAIHVAARSARTPGKDLF